MAIKKRNTMPVAVELALRGYLTPKLAMDAGFDMASLAPALRPLTAANFSAKRAALGAAITKAVQGKLALDADVEDVQEVLEQLGQMAPQIAAMAGGDAGADPAADPADSLDDLDAAPGPDAGDPTAPGAPDTIDNGEVADEGGEGDGDGDENATGDDMASKVMAYCQGKIPDEDMAGLMAIVSPEVAAEDAPAVDASLPPKGGKAAAAAPPPGITKPAMDAAIRAASKQAEQSTINRLRAIAAAEKEVRPVVGELTMAHDSAEAVYKTALDVMKVDTTGVPDTAFPALFRAMPRDTGPKPRMAMDAKPNEGFAKRFPGATALKVR